MVTMLRRCKVQVGTYKSDHEYPLPTSKTSRKGVFTKKTRLSVIITFS